MKYLIVGAGTAGVTLSKRILERSEKNSVELIDVGPRIEQGNRRTWVDHVARGSGHDPYNAYLEEKDDQENDGHVTLRLKGSRYFGEGGSTNAWGGWCIRYNPEDFALRSNTGEGLDWPFDYEALRPFYELAEKTLWVAGTHSPNPPLPYTLKDGVIIEALRSLGISNFGHLPLARRASCLTIGTCKYCPIQQRYIPQVDLHGSELDYKERFNLRLGLAAKRIEMSSTTKCAGVFVDDGNGKEELIEADAVILATGAVETPKLLLRSKSKYWPSGISNNSAHVGRNITAHPLIRVVGVRKGNPDNLEQPVDFPTLVCREYDTEEHQSRGKLLFVRDGRKNATSLETRLKEGASLATVRDEMKRQMPFELRGFIEVFSHPDHYVALGAEGGPFGLPKTKVRFATTEKTKAAIVWAEKKLTSILEAASCEDIKGKTYSTIRADHATSTCRMSSDESEGVVDANLRAHGTENLFVCSNAVMPNGSAANPTLTLIALAERLAQHLTGD